MGYLSCKTRETIGELARIAAEKEKIAADREIEMARIESIERQAEKDREAKLAQIEGDKEAELATEIELEKLKYSFERQHDQLKGQMNLQKAVFKVESEKQKWCHLPKFDKIPAFPTWSVLSLGFSIGYHIYAIKFFQSFHAVNMKLCTDVTCIKNICM